MGSTNTGIKFWTAVGIQSGAIIGAGIFALPYIFQRVGLITGAVYLAVAVLALVLVHLMYGTVAFANSDGHNFVGYVRKYLGFFAGNIATVTSVGKELLVMAIFLILAFRFLSLITLQPIFAAAIFWGLASWVALSGIDRLGMAQASVVGLLVLVVAALFSWSLRYAYDAHVVEYGITHVTALIALGPLLFSLSGRAGAGEAVRYAHAHQLAGWRLRQAIVLGTVVPAVIYLLFIYGVLRLVPLVAEDSLTSLPGIIPSWLLLVVVCVAIAKLWTIYAATGFDVYKNMILDLRWSKSVALFVFVAAPVVIAAWFQHQVIALITFTGGIFFFLEALLVFLMWLKFRNLR